MPVRLYLILGLALLSVSTTSLVVRHLAIVPAVVIAFWRMLTASAMLWSYSAAKPSGKLLKENKTPIILAGVFLGSHFASFFTAIRLTSIASATLLGCLAPFFTCMLEWISGEKLKDRAITGLLLSLFGAFLLQLNPSNVEGELYGNLLAALSSFFLALTWMQAKKIRKNTNTVVYGRSLFFISSITIFFVAFLTKKSIFNFNSENFIWFLFLGFVPSILGHNLLNYSIRFISATSVSSVVLGEPIIASFLGYLIFGEKIPKASWIGGPLILIGLFYLLNSEKEKN